MMLGLGTQVSAQDWLDYGGEIVPATGGSNPYVPILQDITRITGSIASNVLSPPMYRTATTPTGSLTEIRGTGGSINYPGGGAGPTSLPVAGVSMTTMLLLGAAALMMVAMVSRRN